jgi:hypothetical protein
MPNGAYEFFASMLAPTGGWGDFFESQKLQGEPKLPKK